MAQPRVALAFRSVAPDYSFQKVAAVIREAIGRGELKVGDRLPSLRDLQQLFGVSKVTILEALRLLEADGLIEVRLGRNGGAVVLDASRHSLGRAVSLLLDMNHVDLDEVRDLRTAIEAQAARLAVQRATPEQIARLEQLLARLDTAARVPPPGEPPDPAAAERESYVALDLEFHAAVAAASGNRLLQALMDVLYHQVIRRPVPLSPGTQARLNRTLRQVLERGIKGRDAEGAARAMAAHMADSYEVIEAAARAPRAGGGPQGS